MLPIKTTLDTNATGFDTLRLVGLGTLVDIVKGTDISPVGSVTFKDKEYVVEGVNPEKVAVLEIALFTTILDGVAAESFRDHVYGASEFTPVLYVTIIVFVVELLDLIMGGVVTVKEYVGPSLATFRGVISKVYSVAVVNPLNVAEFIPIDVAKF